MAVQWTVSMNRKDLSAEALATIKQVEHVEFKQAGQDRIDMDEETFFFVYESCQARGISLPTDGSDSWAKHT